MRSFTSCDNTITSYDLTMSSYYLIIASSTNTVTLYRMEMTSSWAHPMQLWGHVTTGWGHMTKGCCHMMWMTSWWCDVVKLVGRPLCTCEDISVNIFLQRSALQTRFYSGMKVYLILVNLGLRNNNDVLLTLLFQYIFWICLSNDEIECRIGLMYQ